MRSYFSLFGIRISKTVWFRGFVRLRIVKGAKIEIGDFCGFNSRTMSNKMGLNHPCIITINNMNAKLIIGSNSGFSGVSIGCFKKIEIGSNVLCGANVLITDSDWHQNDFRSGGDKPVKIEDNVWIGYGSIILKGVSIGRNSVIGAGSVVSRSIPENVVAVGNPCKVIRKLGGGEHF